MTDEWISMPRYKLRKYLVKSILQSESLKNKSCLEIGYGAGDMLLMFARMGLRTDGYDFSSMAYQNAKARITDNIRLLKHENEIEKNAYDYLVIFEVLEHIQEDVRALRQFGMYLREHGRIMLSVPSHMSKWGNNDISAGHYRRYEKDELLIKLLSAKFKVIHFWSYGYPLSLVLDIMLHKSCNKNIEEKTKMQREELSKESGIRRKKTIFNLLVSNDVLLFPFYYLQKLFLSKDLGSGYLVFAERA